MKDKELRRKDTAERGNKIGELEKRLSKCHICLLLGSKNPIFCSRSQPQNTGMNSTRWGGWLRRRREASLCQAVTTDGLDILPKGTTGCAVFVGTHFAALLGLKYCVCFQTRP